MASSRSERSVEEDFDSMYLDKVKPDSAHQLVIGLDFGTTFSGIAYGFRDSTDNKITPIQAWPGAEGKGDPKTPTNISYDPDDKTSFTWGSQPHKHHVIEAVKLLLDPDMERPLFLPMATTRADLKKLGKPAEQVAPDYIGAIYKHALKTIEATVTKDYVEMCDRKFVITVPAVWSDKAKDSTLRAAKQAGIHPVEIIKEPEAAALYTLQQMAEKALSEGDAFVICDAGGGTVDLISYSIRSVSPRLELEELVPSKGGMAGSFGLNQRFSEAVKNLVGEDQFYHLRKSEAFEEAMENFDKNIKRKFTGNEDANYYVNFPLADLEDNEEEGLKRDVWSMKGKDVKNIFAPLITSITGMVEEQVQAIRVKRLTEGHSNPEHIKAIFLVGGFGSSEYLKKCLEEKHPDIQIIQPQDAWSAIVKGAVLSLMPDEAQVASSLATKHWGVRSLGMYDEIADKDQRKLWDESEQRHRCFKMQWYILQGEDLQREQRIPFHFFRTLDANYTPDDLVFTTSLESCDTINAPKYPNQSLRPHCTCTVDLRDIDKSVLKSRTGANGKRYYDLFYDLVVTAFPARLIFALEINGKVMGSVDAKYE